MPEWLKWETVLPFLTGALAAQVVGGLMQRRTQRIQLHAEYLRRQIDELYAPLYFLSVRNELYLSIYRDLHQVIRDEYSSEDWSTDPDTQEAISAEHSKVFEIANEYAQLVYSTNDEIFAVISSHSSLSEGNDVDVFKRFIRDYSRHKVEFAGERRLPIYIHEKLGDISVMHPDFTTHFESCLGKKRKELDLYRLSFYRRTRSHAMIMARSWIATALFWLRSEGKTHATKPQ